MNDFRSNIIEGLTHVLDLSAYDHVLFVVVLAVPYLFKDWKRVLLLVTTFTLGHTLSMILGVYNKVSINATLIEFLILFSIFVVAVFNIIMANKDSKHNGIKTLLGSTLFFGLVHGLGFARGYKMLIGKSDDTLNHVMAFAIGIETAQVIVVLIVLILGFVCQSIFKRSRRDWIIIMSAITIGVLLPMLIEFEF